MIPWPIVLGSTMKKHITVGTPDKKYPQCPRSKETGKQESHYPLQNIDPVTQDLPLGILLLKDLSLPGMHHTGEQTFKL